MNLLLFIL